MKNIFKLSFLTLILAFTSCAVDDDAPVVASNVNNLVNLSQTGDITLTQDVTDYTVSMVLTEASSTNTEITYSLNGTETTVIVPPNATSVDLEFSNGLGVVNKIVLLSVAGLFNDSYSIGDDREVTFLGIPTTPIASEPGTTIFTLAWEDAGAFDMDFFLFEGDQDQTTLVDDSQGFSNMEMVRLADSTGDMTYSLFVNQFLFTADVGALVIVTKSDGTTEYYGGTVMQDEFILTFDKSGTDLTFTSLF